MIEALAISLILAAAEPGDIPIPAGPAAPAAEPAPAGPPPAAVPPPQAPGAAPPLAQPPPAAPSAPGAAGKPSRKIDDLNKPLLGGVPQGRYEAGVAGAFAAAENLQGPLDGAWFVATAEGRRLFRFQFDDPGYRGGRIEGAWRDLRAGPGAVEAGGFFTDVQRDGGKLTLRLPASGGQLTVLTLEPRVGGGYGGQLAVGTASLPVVMARP